MMQLSSQQDKFNSNVTADSNSFELKRCPTHSNYNVEVFCSKEGLEPCVMCIKCYLDPEISKHFNGEPLIAVRDLIIKNVDTSNGKSSTQKASVSSKQAESLEQKFLEFNTRDYVGIFERHVESQMKKLDQELDRMKDSLNTFREKFVQFFEKQIEMLKNKEEEIKRRVTQYIEEKEESEKRSFGTLNEILMELNSIDDFSEYEKFIRLLHKRSQYTTEDDEGSSLKKIVDMMASTRTLVSNMKTIKIDTLILEEIREKIESMDIVDKSTIIPGISNVESQLESTLEKIRKAEKKSTFQTKSLSSQQIEQMTKQAKEKEVNNNILPSKERDFTKSSKLFEVLKEKEKPSPYKDKYPSRNQMELEVSKEKEFSDPTKLVDSLLEKYTGSPYKGKLPQRSFMDIEVPKERKEPPIPKPKMDLEAPKPKKDQEFQTPRRDFGHSSAKSSIKKDTGTPKDRRSQEPKLNKSDTLEKEKEISKVSAPFEFIKSVEKSAPEPADKRNLLERLKEKYAIESARKSVSKQASSKDETSSQKEQPQGKGSTSSQYNPALVDLVGTGSVNKTSDKKTIKTQDSSYEPHWYQSRNRLVDEFKAVSQSEKNATEDELDSGPTFSKEGSLAKSPDNSANLKTSNQQNESKSNVMQVSPNQSHLKFASTSQLNKSDSDYLIDPKQTPGKSRKDNKHSTGRESESSDPYYRSTPRGTPLSEKSAENLIQQTIDQKLNGFMVFQNTLRYEEPDISEDFNKYSSQKWIQITKAERDEYSALAVDQRSILKEEFKLRYREMSDLTELQIMLDQRIKEIRK